jgi:glucose-1-phosphate thymidylyltransferase
MAVDADKAVILARGLGTRMQRADPAAALEPEQARLAAAGIKAMIPFGRPFLDFVLSTLADAGYRYACLVIGPEHGLVREYYTRTRPPERIRVSFAIQERPRGTADAVAAAEAFVAGERFLVINSDNYYPVEALRALRTLGSPGLAAFAREALMREGSIDAARIRRFAVVRIGPAGDLDDIVEKPDEATLTTLGPDVWVSMNCWSFGQTIFRACASVLPSARGELELTDAVRFAIRSLGERFHVLTFDLPVLDLSGRADIAAVGRRLARIEPRP